LNLNSFQRSAPDSLAGQAIAERWLSQLHRFSTDLSGIQTDEALFNAVRNHVATNNADLPFSLIYLFDASAAQARLACQQGLEQHSKFAPESIDLQTSAASWPAGDILRGVPLVVVDDVSSQFQLALADIAEATVRMAVVLPIAQQGSATPTGFLVVGINPPRPLDSAYSQFLELFAHQVSVGLSNVRVRAMERKHADALAELERAKSTFFSTVSRELRTPLTLMLAPMEDLLRAPPDRLVPELRERAAIAHRNGLRLLKLVNTILDFAQIEAGRVHAIFVPTDLTNYTRELASSFRGVAEGAGLELVVDCQPLPEPVHIDRDLWEKIVLNLLSNAFKFTLDGEIRVSVKPVPDGAEFAVQDTGMGISAEARQHVFDRFHGRASTSSAVRSYEGPGIGLALVHELVKLHGGTIDVDTNPGVGSTFTVVLRYGRAHLPEDTVPPPDPASMHSALDVAALEAELDQLDAAASSDAPPLRPANSRGKVLVVDDNADMRRYVARLLSSSYEVVTAVDGLAALDIVRTQKLDLVLTDVMMPKLDGFGLLKAIRAHADLRTIPVILLSARAAEESRIEGLDAGADDFLVKPFAARELLARVNVHLQMARIRGEAEERERELRTNAETFAKALRESTERLSASLAAAGTGTFRWDLKTNLFHFDESLNRLFGLPTGQIVPPRSLPGFINLVHPDDRARVTAAADRVVKQGDGFDLEFRVRLPDGSTRWLDDKGQTFFDETGQAIYMTGACVDITKRKQAEAFVWRQKDVLEQIVQGAPLADVLETLTLDVEQVAERKLIAMVTMVEPDGKRLRTVAGRRSPPGWRDVFTGAEIGLTGGSCGAAAFRKERIVVRDVMTSPLWEKHRTEAVKRGLRACWSTPIVSSRGSVMGTFAIYYQDPSAPTEDEIRFVDIVTRTAAIAVERDRSELALKESREQLAQHAQQLEQRVQERTAKLQETISELESFSYSISHDMRAPLRAMHSFAQILNEDCGDKIGPQGKDYIRRIIGASDRMDRLIQDVLTYSRVTRTELQLEPINVESLLDGVLESYPQFHPPHALIEVKRPLPRVMGNEAALVQCLSNLIGNAIKFVAPDVVPRVQIWAETNESRVRLYVRDNGIGIEPDAHEKIFRIFYQLDRSYDGTGIGLSVVRKAAERMGGTVGLKSELNRGSTFHLDLVLAS
jgi:PAS domain S-box-containing protein